MARKQHAYHYIYKTTCSVTGRYYIGMHSTSNLEDGYLGSGKRLWYSIKKHGKENHNREILEFVSDRKTLAIREKEIVTDRLREDLLCMNLMNGGEGGRGFISADQQKRRAIAAGKATALKLKTDPIFREEFSKRISLNNSIKHANGILHAPNWTGKTHRPETKQKIGDANVENHLGSKNSQYGTMWITDGHDNRKIKKTDNIPIGWKIGRILKNNDL